MTARSACMDESTAVGQLASQSDGYSAPPRDLADGISGWLFVLSWSPAESGGVSNVVKNLIRCFREGAAFSPSLLISDAASATKEPAPIEGVRPFHLDVWGPVDHLHPTRALLSFFYRLPGLCWSLHRIIRREKITVINPHFPGLECLTFVIVKKLNLFRGKIILSFHRGDIHLALETRGFGRRLWRVLLKSVDYVVVVSDDLGRAVLSLEPSTAGKVRTIYNGVDSALLPLAGSDSDSQLSAKDFRRSIISVGQFIPRKGYDVLVRAFTTVASQFPDLRLVLIGQDGPEFERLQHLIVSLALTGRVEIHLNVPHKEVSRFLSKATLYASASRGEGFPLAVLEAGAAGLPVICTRAPGQRELVNDGLTGRMVEVDDAAALADAIVDLLKNPDKARRLADNFSEEVKAKYTWQNAYEQYVNLARTR